MQPRCVPPKCVEVRGDRAVRRPLRRPAPNGLAVHGTPSKGRVPAVYPGLRRSAGYGYTGYMGYTQPTAPTGADRPGLPVDSEPPTFRSSGPRCFVRRRLRVSVEPGERLWGTPPNSRELQRMRPGLRPDQARTPPGSVRCRSTSRLPIGRLGCRTQTGFETSHVPRRADAGQHRASQKLDRQPRA